MNFEERMESLLSYYQVDCTKYHLITPKGGATMGMYHIGVVKALFEEGLLPQVVSGTSAGIFIEYNK